MRTQKEKYMMDFVKDIISKLDIINNDNLEINWEDDIYEYICRKIIWKDMTEIILRRKYKSNNTNKKTEYDNICFYKYEEAFTSVKEKFAYRRENTRHYGKPLSYQVYFEGYIFETYTHYHYRKN
jgi:hypothetical protein